LRGFSLYGKCLACSKNEAGQNLRCHGRESGDNHFEWTYSGFVGELKKLRQRVRGGTGHEHIMFFAVRDVNYLLEEHPSSFARDEALEALLREERSEAGNVSARKLEALGDIS
jgi:hypothetical protein